MNYKVLEKVLCETIKEEQIKLGYVKETIRLYYPMSSLAHILGVEGPSIPLMNELLEGFVHSTADKLGKIQISHKADRYCLMIPPEGVLYVHEVYEDNPFLKEFISIVREHDCTLEDLLKVFHTFSDQVVCEKSSMDEFDYVIYFSDGRIDDYRYCVKFEHGHTTYHRFTRMDYINL